MLLPGYTHLQLAMPSSFGLWFGAYAEGLADDMLALKAAYDVVNKNPLGSAAGYGSSFPINRTLTTQLLGFADLELQRGVCTNGPRQSRAHRGFGPREYCRYFIALKHGCLPVPEPEFWLYFFPARAYYGQQHYAAQKEPRCV